MSLYLNVLSRSFIVWFKTLFYWNQQKINVNIKKLSPYNNFFYKKELFVSTVSIPLILINFLLKIKVIKGLKNINYTTSLGLKSLWLHLRLWIFPLTISILIFFNFMYVKALPFNKVVFLWTAVFMIFYWLISGFVFFIKKYQYGKYTSAVQRFWKRSYIIFWLLETCLLLVFVYLTFTASQESFYMFDQIQIYKTHLFSWRLFLYKNIPVILLITLGYFLILTLKWNTFSKHSVWLLVITFILTYIIWIEFYQFYHIVNFYGNLNWIYDFDDKVWNLELEARRTRIVNNYMMLLLILRFWHLIFVFLFWIFFVLRGCEIKRLRYPLLAANFQNFIILYIMNWITMYPWFKVTIRKYLNQPYTVFNVNNRTLFLRIFFNDIKLFLLNLFELNIFFLKNIFIKDFFYFNVLSSQFSVQHIRKHYIKDVIVTELKIGRNFSFLNGEVIPYAHILSTWVNLFVFIEKLFIILNFNFFLDYVGFIFISKITSTIRCLVEYFLYGFSLLFGFFI